MKVKLALLFLVSLIFSVSSFAQSAVEEGQPGAATPSTQPAGAEAEPDCTDS